VVEIDARLKYLGFELKTNMYKKGDWKWLISKVERKLNTSCSRWLFRWGHVVLVKVVLEAILFY
jgi:hypothetical protein